MCVFRGFYIYLAECLGLCTFMQIFGLIAGILFACSYVVCVGSIIHFINFMEMSKTIVWVAAVLNNKCVFVMDSY